MKKLTALILTAVMLVCMTAIVPVNAEGAVIPVVAEAPDSAVELGSEFTVKWDLSENPGFAGLLFSVTFDPEVFEIAEAYDDWEEVYFIDWKCLADSGLTVTPNFNNKDNGEVRFLAFTDGTKDYTKLTGRSSAFLELPFKVKDGVETGNYEITFAFDNSNEDCMNKDKVVLDVSKTAVATISIKGIDPITPPVGPTVVDGLKTVGGQVRVPVNGVEPEKFGFRFVATMDSTVEAVEYGTLVIPTELLVGDLVVENTVAEQVVAAKIMSEVDGVVTFNATMVDIKDANLDNNFTTRAYAKLADGSYVYGATYETNIYKVAKAAVEAGEAVEYLTENVLSKVNK